MKILSTLLLIVTLSIGTYTGVRFMLLEGFRNGIYTAQRDSETCLEGDDSKEFFPEYFKACQTLCQELYSDNNICVSRISGGSVTCVCEQTQRETE